MPSSSSVVEKLKDFKSEDDVDITPEVWTPPALKSMTNKSIVAFDQTLTQAGYVAFQVKSAGFNSLPEIKIFDKGVFKQQTDLKSFAGNYEKGNMLAEKMYRLLCYVPANIIVHEMPAVYGYRTDSALLAGMVVQREADRRKIRCDIVSAQHARRVIGGPSCKKKQDVKAALKPYVDNIDTREWNEHTRDALLIGLAKAYEEGQSAYKRD